MNIFLWVLQVVFALHTLMGAFWKFTNSEQAVPSLTAIPPFIWMALIAVEFIAAAGLVLPLINKKLGKLVPIAAGIIAAEMIFFSIVHLATGNGITGEVIYWLVVAGFCSFIAYGRSATNPIQAVTELYES